MIRFILLSVLLGATIAQNLFQQRECQFMKKAYSKAAEKFQRLAVSEINFKRVRSDDIGNVFTTLLLAMQTFLSMPGQSSSTLSKQTNCIDASKRCSNITIEDVPADPRYRTISGAHNNIRFPKRGMSYTPYGSLVDLNFADGISEIRKSVVGQKELPEARTATNAINEDPFKCIPDFPANFMSVMFGQLMAHDHGGRQMRQPKDGGATRTCCNADYTKPLSPQPFACNAFTYAKDDPFLNEAVPKCNIGCQNFIRSQTTLATDCSLGPHRAVNQVSHYLDLSPVYGNTVEIANELRTLKDGLLKNNPNKVLPRTCNNPAENCYLTGDYRGTGIYFLGILQSMYHRFHNIVAEQLKALNPKWTDERFYQEARRIVIAVYQHHVVDWLRIYAGDKDTKRFRPVGNNYVGKYDATLDASSTVEFSHCAFRVYHSNLADEITFVSANKTVLKTVRLDDNDVGLLPLETNYDDIARGMIFTSAGHASFTPTVRHKLFNNDNPHNLGIDIISTDLFIGRDLGVQPYHVYFKKATGKTVKSWNDLLTTMPAAAVESLKAVYKSVLDVDAYAGVSLETKCDSYLGTVGKWLVVEQYKRTTLGDRFFYSLPDGAYPFSRTQLEKIYNFSYSNFVCTVTGLTEVPLNAFEFLMNKNVLVPCKRGIDLSPWKGLK